MPDFEEPKWRNNRERITYEEGRHVLEAQKSDIDDIDDKALRTVRITALLLGVGATGLASLG
jgi:exosome complex RNA-binding protein Rrp42 (RNase PH superfamily)